MNLTNAPSGTIRSALRYPDFRWLLSALAVSQIGDWLYNLALVYEKVDPKEAISLWERYIALAGPQPTEKDWVDVAKLHLRKLKNQFEKDK